MAKQTEPTEPAKPKRTPRPMNRVIQTLARVDRLFAEHNAEERARMVAWLQAAHGPGADGKAPYPPQADTWKPTE